MSFLKNTLAAASALALLAAPTVVFAAPAKSAVAVSAVAPGKARVKRKSKGAPTSAVVVGGLAAGGLTAAIVAASDNNSTANSP